MHRGDMRSEQLMRVVVIPIPETLGPVGVSEQLRNVLIH